MAVQLEAFLRQLGEQFDADFRTRVAVSESEEKARRNFLEGFRSMVTRDVLPVFELSAECCSETLLMEIGRGDGDMVELTVTVKVSATESLRGALRYSPNLATKQAIRDVQKHGEKLVSEPITPDLLAFEEVKKSVADLVNSFKTNSAPRQTRR